MDSTFRANKASSTTTISDDWYEFPRLQDLDDAAIAAVINASTAAAIDASTYAFLVAVPEWPEDELYDEPDASSSDFAVLTRATDAFADASLQQALQDEPHCSCSARATTTA